MSRSRNTQKGRYNGEIRGVGDVKIDPTTGKVLGWREKGSQKGKQNGKKYAARMRRRRMEGFEDE